MSWKGGSICLQSSAESREYILTYFGEREHIFIGGMEAYIYWGDGSKSLGDAYPHPLDLHPWSLANIDDHFKPPSPLKYHILSLYNF